MDKVEVPRVDKHSGQLSDYKHRVLPVDRISKQYKSTTNTKIPKSNGNNAKRRTGLFKRDKFWALQDISFDLYKGETLGVIGRNGVGKSSLLRVLADIVPPDKGEVQRAENHRASLLSLQAGFVPYLSGRINIVVSGMLLGLTRQEVMSRMDEVIRFSGLEAFIDVPVSTYSAGMRARLGFSITHQCDPEIILIDEVLGVGDEEFKKMSTAAMKEKIHSNKTVVIVSHQVPTIKELCDRVVWVDQGQTIAVGPTEEILEMYKKK